MELCPQCGAELSSESTGDLCSRCLIAGVLETTQNGPSSEPETETLAAKEDRVEDGFGRYRILRVLGEGGMGTVYLAEQAEPIRRQVALKVVKLGMGTSEVLARFNNERQALAIMDHANVARIFDAGATASGRPYFVMEYIDGISITRYCDCHQLTTKERLEVFLTVCRAVQHAHQKGVIHRDIKPSNVLVIEQDSRPIPKIIDFGISKATDQRALENTLITEFGQMVGTPEYMSPEQSDVVAGDIGASSDIYSLGVLLYELLIGAVPFDAASLRKVGLAEMLRIIREEEAPSLPDKLSSMGPRATDVAARRRTDPLTLRRLVHGDLNWIAMKALEKTRERRYASVSDLAADIQRHLEDRPVLAGPPGRLYRVGKFVRRHKPAVSAVAASVLMMALAGGTVWSLSRYLGPQRQPKLTDRDTIVIADFMNTTGDPVFDGTLRQGLTVQLGQSPLLSLVSEQRIERTLRLMNQPADARLPPALARGVCERMGGGAVVEGSISSIGTSYVLGLRARNCGTGDVLAEEQAQATRKEDVLNTMSQIATRFRTRIGESISTVEKHDTPLEATTPSLEALQAYSEGRKIQGSRGTVAALRLFQRAVEIDPNFATAHNWMAGMYGNLDEFDLAAQSATKAYQLRDRASDAERFSITAFYDRLVTGNMEKVQQTCELWSRTYPRDATPHGLLAGSPYVTFGKYEQALEQAREAVKLDPDFAIVYYSLASKYLILDRLGEAEDILRRAAERKLDIQELYYARHNLAFLKGDKPGMEKVLAESKSRSEAEALTTEREAFALAYAGHVQQARNMMRRATDLARQAGQRERPAEWEAGAALWEVFFGNAATAKEGTLAALQHFRGREVRYMAALVLAMLGDSPRSQALANELEKRFPEDTSVQFNYLPTLRARLALNRGDPAKAIELLEPAVPYEMGTPRVSGTMGVGALYPIYVRGEAYLAEHQGAKAAAEFQRILDHRGIVLSDPIGVLARLQVGRALVLSGDKAKAKAAYQDFLALWKDADPDIPILRQAWSETAKL